MSAIVHMAGPKMTANGHLRQRCGWCGALLFDYDLANVAVVGEEWREPGTAEPDTWWAVDGNMGYAIEPEPHDTAAGNIKIPDGACINLDNAVTS